MHTVCLKLNARATGLSMLPESIEVSGSCRLRAWRRTELVDDGQHTAREQRGLRLLQTFRWPMREDVASGAGWYGLLEHVTREHRGLRHMQTACSGTR